MFNLLAVSMPVIVDIVAAAFVIIMALMGMSRGFAKTFFSAFGTLIALLAAVLLAPTIVKVCQDSFGMVNFFSEKITGVVTKIFGADLMGATLGSVSEQSMITAGVSGWLIKLILMFKGEGSFAPETTVQELLCPTFAYYLSLIIVVVALFIILKIVMSVIGKFVSRLHEIGLINFVDRVLGLGLGLIMGVVYLGLILMIIGVIPVPIFQQISASIVDTKFASFIANINIYGRLMELLSNFKLLDVVKGLAQPTPPPVA